MAFKSSALPLIIIIIPLFFFALFSSPGFPSSDPPWVQGSLMQEKTRLGSTPPSCYNKCDGCHPCTAVKVPASPGLHRVQLSPSRSERQSYGVISEYDSFPGATNYKPLGWKCRCKDRLYNP
uniref:Epidermal patterning factor-like protein n=1 Tax=Opuntia streptacantha TaxID=393608 RepID=A0A7C9DZ12_OPUST